MAAESCSVRDSIREVDDDSWVIGGRLLLSRRPSPPISGGAFWSDGARSFYTLTEASQPPPESRPLPTTSPFEKVYDAGNASAVWRIGEAFCKVKLLYQRVPRATREHVTLDMLNKRTLSFAIPQVHHHAEFDGVYYIFLSKIQGETLTQAWVKMEEEIKQNVVSQVVSICKELAVWEADRISGVDGGFLPDQYLTPRRLQKDCSPVNLLSGCRELGMDCSIFLFYHCDLGPGNIIIDTAITGQIVGIIDWETAGFVPKAWIRSKFTWSSGLDLPGDDMDERVDYRRRVVRQLAEEGFPDVGEQWFTWWNKGN